MELQKLYEIYLESPLISTDTRKIHKESIFFALKGDNFNGNLFAEQAINLGAKIAIVDDEKCQNTTKGIYCVADTLVCLQELANLHRKKMNIPVIGLTGSNGKTTTKELVAAVLQQKFNVLYTQGNLNNHIGVPLTLLSINKEHEIAVIEMGANHQKEIADLCAICMPNIGYITNFGKAHLEGFGGFEGVVKGKSELYQHLKTHNQKVVVNLQDNLQIEHSKNILNKITFGTTNSDYFIETSTSKNNYLAVKYKEVEIQSNLTGDYNFSNISVAIALGLYFSISIEKIKQGIESYYPNNLRSQILIKENKQILLDTYNANPSSMEVALINFALFEGEKIVVLGDMFELGETEAEEHQKIAEIASNLKFDLILLVGERFFKINAKNHKNINKFKSKEDLLVYLKKNNTPLNILIKASRGMALENIVHYL